MKSFFPPNDEFEVLAWRLVNKLNLKITKTTLRAELHSHPYFPSIYSLNEIFEKYKVANLGLSAPYHVVESDLPLPAIVKLKDRESHHFVYRIVEEINDTNVLLYNPEIDATIVLPKLIFKKEYANFAMIFEANEYSGEVNYLQKLKSETRSSRLKKSVLGAVGLLTLAAILTTVQLSSGNFTIGPIIHLILSVIGSMVGVVLLNFEIDSQNSSLPKFCKRSSKTDCSSVLTSGSSKIFGISWSHFGVSYFLTLWLYQLATGIFETGSLQVISFFSISAVSYSLFSIWYQWRVIKQWCILCLLVQAILILQFILVVGTQFYTETTTLTTLTVSAISFISIFIFLFVVLFFMIAYGKRAKMFEAKANELDKLKMDKPVFDALLNTQKTIEGSPYKISLVLGDINAKNLITMVSNPYCDPCKKAHNQIEDLVAQNKDIQVHIIFATDSDKSRALPVAHFLAMEGEYDRLTLIEALHFWYNSERDYESIALKFPVKKIEEQFSKIELMNEWCNCNSIMNTPSFYVNGKKLPTIYSASDLAILLK
ncbi:MAG: thioredoxin domain-containing protein [Chitinophagaceae bacterium]|nr:thioredoxin domain-containing protein [Chitinophagaceae bacterium]